MLCRWYISHRALPQSGRVFPRGSKNGPSPSNERSHPLAQTVSPPRVKHVHLALDSAMWAELKRKLINEDRDLSRHLRRLIAADLGKKRDIQTK